MDASATLDPGIDESQFVTEAVDVNDVLYAVLGHPLAEQSHRLLVVAARHQLSERDIRSPLYGSLPSGRTRAPFRKTSTTKHQLAAHWFPSIWM